MPEVSVIIPAYNSAHFLPAAIDSVLAQTCQDFEVLVIDDGSTDDTEAVMRRYGSPVRCLRQPNRGVAVARNSGIAESRGRYVAFLDADDAWYPHKLERQLTELAQSADHCRACYSSFMLADSSLAPLGLHRAQRHGAALEDLLTVGNVVGTPSTVLGERDLFLSLKGFDPAFSMCADWDMWVRVASMTEFLYVDEPLILYRQHGNNMSRNAPLLESDSLQVLEKGFAMPDLSRRLRQAKRVAYGRNYMVLAGTYYHAGRYHDFLRCAAYAVGMDFRQLWYLLAFPVRRAMSSFGVRRFSGALF